MAITPLPSQCPFSDPSKLFEDLATLQEKPSLEYSEVLNAYVVTRYDDIVHILDQPEIFSSRVTVPDPPDFLIEKFKDKVPTRGTLLGWDNPDHDRLRKSVSSFFVPRRLERFEPLIRKLAHELVDEFMKDGEGDLKIKFALPLPLKVIANVVGLDPASWEWIGKSLALFGGHAHFASGTIDEKIQGIMDIHEYVAELIQQRKGDRRDDMISHIWNERDAGRVAMTDFEHLAMVPGLLLAGHETTTNLFSMGVALLLRAELWDEVNVSGEKRKEGIEELLRYESAITGMKREVLQDTTIGSTKLKKGNIVFAAYNAGSRDPSHFSEPNAVCPGRKTTTQHLGFGRGIHACLGAPLARLLLRIEFDVIHERLPGLKLQNGFQGVYDHVHEGRGVNRLMVQWNVKQAEQKGLARRSIGSKPSSVRRRSEQKKIQVVVESTASIAEDVLLITMKRVSDKPLPCWTAGAHIDMPVGELGYRQYSLCSDPDDSSVYQVAVLRERHGTGGSEYIHTQLHAGMSFEISAPRNHFKLRPAKKYIFVAGGIGITPIRAIIYEAKASGVPYKLIYLSSSRSRMAFVDEFEKHEDTTIWPKDERGHFDLANLPKIVRDGSLLYACGPTRLLASLEDIFADRPAGTLNVEHFNAVSSSSFAPNKAFDVVLNRSNRTLHVPTEKSILEVLQSNGVSILSTCAKGTCGTCEVDVLEGEVEHRDVVLTEEEKREGKSMMACVSRCLSSRLVLDLW